jgi:hypothetical protein
VSGNQVGGDLDGDADFLGSSSRAH